MGAIVTAPTMPTTTDTPSQSSAVHATTLRKEVALPFRHRLNLRCQTGGGDPVNSR